MPHELGGMVGDRDVLSPMLWEDNGYLHTTQGSASDIIDFNIGLNMGVEILGVRHIGGVRSQLDNTLMSLFAEITLDLGATEVGGAAANVDTFENNNAIWNDAIFAVTDLSTNGAFALQNGPFGADWWPRQPMIIAQNLNVITSMVETVSGSFLGNIRVWFRYVSLSDASVVRLLARGRFR